MSKFPEIFKELRKERKISLAELSAKTGINQGYPSGLKRGKKSNSSAEVLSKLAGAFGVTSEQPENLRHDLKRSSKGLKRIQPSVCIKQWNRS